MFCEKLSPKLFKIVHKNINKTINIVKNIGPKILFQQSFNKAVNKNSFNCRRPKNPETNDIIKCKRTLSSVSFFSTIIIF